MGLGYLKKIELQFNFLQTSAIAMQEYECRYETSGDLMFLIMNDYQNTTFVRAFQFFQNILEFANMIKNKNNA